MVTSKKKGYFINEIPYGLKGKIFQSPMPFSPYDPENCIWSLYLQKKIDCVVVLAQKQEMLRFAQRDLLKFYKSNKSNVIHYPIPDYQIPMDSQNFNRLIEDVVNQATLGRHLACHCLAGLGRTGLLIAAIARKSLGLDGTAAIDWIRDLLPGSLENKEQERFIHELII